MSAPRRRRWMDVLRRTAGVGDGGARAPTADDAALWGAFEQASSSVEDAGARAERVAASVARQRTLIEAAAERANLVAARSEGLGANAARVNEAFERLGVVALNAGLEGARVPEPQGRALLLLSEEIRANVVRGGDATSDLARSVDEIAVEASEVRKQLERARAEVADVGQEAAQVRATSIAAGRALDDLGGRLRKATGIDPEVARAVGLATEHARGLMRALSTLSSVSQAQPVLSAIQPVLGPLLRLLGDLEAVAPPEGDETT